MNEWMNERTIERTNQNGIQKNESITKTETCKEAYHNLVFLQKKRRRNVNQNVCVCVEKRRGKRKRRAKHGH